MAFKGTMRWYKHINILSFQLQMNSGEREVSKIYHSTLIFGTDAKLNPPLQINFQKPGLKMGVENGMFWSNLSIRLVLV